MQNFTRGILQRFMVLVLGITTTQLVAQTSTPTVSGLLAVCSGSTTTLTATGAAGASFAWYDAPSGGNLLFSNAIYTTAPLTANTHFYVVQTVAGSASPAYDVFVQVAPIPGQSAPTNVLASPSSICQGSSSNLSATVDAGAGQYVYWYDAATGGNLLGSSASGANFTVSPNSTTTYYAQSQAQIIKQTFNFTGGVQTFTVPAGVTSIQVDARGGRGGYDYEYNLQQGLPGYGGRVQATMNVTPGQVLYIYVGERGYGYLPSGEHTAFNGGGPPPIGSVNAGGGGGATDIRINGQALINRVLVAGGGGGSGTVTQAGGGGGGLTGGNGTDGNYSGYGIPNSGGRGGSQTAGGAGGDDHASVANGGVTGPSGSLGQGAAYGTGSVSSIAVGGAGGGGYYGGGGGIDYGGGGGGSSYTDPAIVQNVVHTQGFQNDNGQLIITYNSTANCASATRQPVTLTVYNTPVVGAGSNVITCAGTGVNLNATGADTYTWQPGGLTGSSVFVTPGTTTNYVVTGMLNNGGCSSTANVTVTVTSVSASADQSICLNNSATLNASGADSYTWQPGNLTGSSVQVSPSSSTTYTVTGYNNSGCSTTAQTKVNVNPLPNVNIGTGVSVPAGTSVTLTATGADNYSWSTPYASGNASITFTPSVTSTWSVTGYYSATGCSKTASAVVTVASAPSVTGNTIVCVGNTSTLTATGDAPLTWYNTASGGNPLFTGSIFTTPPVQSAITYWVSANGSARVPVNITTAVSPFDAVATPSTICAGSPSALTLSGTTQTVNWYDDVTGNNLLATETGNSAFSVSPPVTKVYYAQMQSALKPDTATFNFTGSVQTFTVPAGVTSIQVDARGGRGGYDYEYNIQQGLPGYGGRVQATMNVTPGQVLYIYVGERGYGYLPSGEHTAYNGGGPPPIGSPNAGGGGGATDIRINGQALTNRVLVAGGGGGSGTVTQAGGGGGGLTGGNGTDGNYSGYGIPNSGGRGGSQTAGGAGGDDHASVANGGVTGPSGSLGQGAAYGTGSVSSIAVGGAGGGGYYGGGGGIDYGGGGGGSSYTDPAIVQNVIHTQGFQNDNGQLYIIYNLAATCNLTVPDTVTVNAVPAVSPVTGTTSVCAGQKITLSDATHGGSWSSDNTSVATVDANGIVSGLTDGTANISYSISNNNGCSSKQSVLITVNALASISPITGTTSVCAGQKITLSDATGGGTWSSDNTSVATVDENGMVSGLTDGTANISYSISNNNGCSGKQSVLITVNALASISPITGTTSVCAGQKITLSDATDGGTWSSDNTSVATVDENGMVSGLTDGTANISYTISNNNGCSGKQSVLITVNALASISPITGTTSVCAGQKITLSDATDGGTWISDNTSVATVDENGMVSGLTDGTANISYSISNNNGCSGKQSVLITVNALASISPITGTTSVCAGQKITLSDATVGGTWSSDNTSVATVDANGIVSGLTDGTANISYSISNNNGCSGKQSVLITVNALASISPITGTTSVCAGQKITLSDATVGGTWSSDNTSVATVDANGIVSGLTDGTANISYSISNNNGCSGKQSVLITVNALASISPITGTTSVCAGQKITLSDATGGETWSSDNTSVATVDANGMVSGLTDGTANISYTISNNNGCSGKQSVLITVNALASISPITGTTSVCAGQKITLSDATTGGTWSSDNTSVAMVDANGVVSGLTDGTANISYTISNNNGCSGKQSVLITVNALATISPISGVTGVCIGQSTTLGDATGGGIWSSDNTAVATVGSNGVVNGLSNGTANISYTVSNNSGCSGKQTVTVKVNALQSISPVTGLAKVCVGQTITLKDLTSSGTWSSDNTTVATVNANGVVSGLSAGTANISYIVTNNSGCAAKASVRISVNAIPTVAAITGTTNLCLGSNFALHDATAGGTWSSSNSSVASINNSGIVTIIRAGTVTISYTVKNSNGCQNSNILAFAINPPVTVAPVTGTKSVCVSSTTTLKDAVTGGVWSSSNTRVATISQSGLVTGISAGSSTITYTVGSGTCKSVATTSVSVIAAPVLSAISGNSQLMKGASTILSDATRGGVWSSSNSSIAGISSAGVLKGISAGSCTVYYTVTNSTGCSNVVSKTITVYNALAAVASAGKITCPGVNTTLVITATGGSGTYQYSLNNGKFQSGNVFTVTSGIYTVIVKDNMANQVTIKSIVITQPAPLLVKLVKVTSATKNSANGSFTVSGSGGTAPYTYSINGTNYQASATFNNLSAATYQVSVKDANNCTVANALKVIVSNGVEKAAVEIGETESVSTPDSVEEPVVEALVGKVFPNPTTSSFTLVLHSTKITTVEIMVYDIMGHALYHTRGSANSSYLFGSNFVTGPYIVEIIYSGGVKIIKVVKD